MLRKFAEFFALLVATTLATYYVPEGVKAAFYVLLLILYFRSKNEPLWLAFFLTISDGFWGFFNLYEAVLSVIPGLPPIEIAHLYIVLSAVKAYKRPNPGVMFHDNFLKILGIYVLFLIAQGYLLGLSPQLNVQFRMVKFVLPFLMFYSVPRLFQSEENFREFFLYLFPMAFFALFAQVFTISTGIAPSQFLGVFKKLWFTVDVSKGKTYRGFYSSATVLTCYFGAFYQLARRSGYFNINYLFSVMAACLLCVVLSATRGWLLGFSLGLILYLVLVLRLSIKRLATVVGTGAVMVAALMLLPVVKTQFDNAFKRFTTLEKLASGDVTAGGTLSRINERSPRVLDKWSEAPFTGWGFSDAFFKHGDFHVGNQNILLHAGIIGAILMGFFIIFFHWALLARSLQLHRGNPYKAPLLVFVVFFPGWFLIHSSSGQHFAFYSDPANSIVLTYYLTLGALTYRLSFNPKPQAADASIHPPDEAEV